MVFLVSGLSWTPPPLMALPTPVGPAAVLTDDVEVAGADDRRRPDRMDGSEAVRVGYRCATCARERRISACFWCPPQEGESHAPGRQSP